jgi:hypothetical protein
MKKQIYIKNFRGIVKSGLEGCEFISNKTRRHELPTGITISVNNVRSPQTYGFAKWFDVRIVDRKEINGRLSAVEFLIMRIYPVISHYGTGSEEDEYNKQVHWVTEFNGTINVANSDEVMRVKDFCMNYANNFKLNL